MSIILDCQPKMAFVLRPGDFDDIFTRPQKLHDRKRQIRKALGTRSPALLKKFRKSARIRGTWKLRSKLRGDGLDPIPSFWGLYYPSNRQGSFLFKESRHRHIGCDHETLDDLFRYVVTSENEVFNHIVFYNSRGFNRAEC